MKIRLVQGRSLRRIACCALGALLLFQVAHSVSAQDRTRLKSAKTKYYACVDSAGAKAYDTKPISRCDSPQTVRGSAGPPIPPTLTEAEAEPFKRLHPQLRVSPLYCGSDEITYCEGMVRISCNAGGDAPVRYHDNATAELLGTCGAWVNNPKCMPQRWKVCAVKNRVLHIYEEPDPSR